MGPRDSNKAPGIGSHHGLSIGSVSALSIGVALTVGWMGSGRFVGYGNMMKELLSISRTRSRRITTGI
jgi:hypothetical protein